MEEQDKTPDNQVKWNIVPLNINQSNDSKDNPRSSAENGEQTK